MKGYISRILALILILGTVLTSAGCTLVLDVPGGNGGGQGGSGEQGGTGESGGSGDSEGDSGESGGEVVFPGGDEEQLPDEWEDTFSQSAGCVSVRVLEGCETDLKEYLGEDSGTDISWQSRCDGIATVEDGICTGVKVGRTLITAYVGESAVMEFSVTVEFKISQNSGFNIVTDVVDEQEYKVTSMKEANQIIDKAIAAHTHKLTIDFSGISPDFTAEDFDLDSELGNHTSLRMLFYDDAPYRIIFEIVYKTDSASNTIEEGSVSGSAVKDIGSVNAKAYSALKFKDATPRVDNFDNFAINSEDIPEWTVYNSEELWWVIEHGYRPVFPETHTKAELFYERAKMILREIIHDQMTDYERVRAIYEYLVLSVHYDYDAYFGLADRDNTCYFLEGVFEAGRAVCDGKSKAFVLLCGIEGIPCVRDFGASATGGAGHAWNYVQLDGVWYLYDTTEGDIRYKVESGGIGEYLGYDVEMLSYSGYMREIGYLSEKYVYTDKWSEITELQQTYVPYGYFEYDLTEGIDFVIGSSEEADGLFEAAIDGDSPDTLVILFIPEDEKKCYSYFEDVNERYGYECSIFTTDYLTETVYVAIFKTETTSEK